MKSDPFGLIPLLPPVQVKEQLKWFINESLLYMSYNQCVSRDKMRENLDFYRPN